MTLNDNALITETYTINTSMKLSETVTTSFEHPVNQITKSAFFHLKNIACLSQSLSSFGAMQTSRNDNFNSILCGIHPKSWINSNISTTKCQTWGDKAFSIDTSSLCNFHPKRILHRSINVSNHWSKPTFSEWLLMSYGFSIFFNMFVLSLMMCFLFSIGPLMMWR